MIRHNRFNQSTKQDNMPTAYSLLIYSSKCLMETYQTINFITNDTS